MTTAPPDNEVLSARALVKSYNGSPALRGLSLGVREGEILAVTGPRGCGKTTLLNCLSGHLPPDEGEVWFGTVAVHLLSIGERDKLRRERFGWIGTSPELVPELTVCENTALPLLLGGASHTEAKTAAQEWLERLDIADCARRRPAELLQAQRQRVSIARSLVTRPTVLFADEPTAPVHRADQGQILRTLTAACRSHGITIVLATNDEEVASYADRGVALLDGRRDGGEPVLARAVINPPIGEESSGPATAAVPPSAKATTPRAASAVAATPTPSPGRSASAGLPGRGAQRPSATVAGAAGGQTTNGTAVAVSGFEDADRCSASA